MNGQGAESCSAPLTNALMPNLSAQDRLGRAVRLWDYRQKSHVALLLAPEAEAGIWRSWDELIAQNGKIWTWLGIEFLRGSQVPGLAEGLYLMDRYGQLIQFLPPGQWTADQIEQTYLYHEAARC